MTKDYIVYTIWFEIDGFPALDHLRTACKIEGFCNNVDECYRLIESLKNDDDKRKGYYIAKIIEADLEFCM